MLARIACIAGFLLCALATVEAATGSVALYADNRCFTPVKGTPSAAGGLPTDGTCTPLGYDSSSRKIFHRLTCGGANGPQYDYFQLSYSSTATDGCSGTPLYSIRGTSTTTDSTCLTPTSSSALFFSVEIQCTEKIYQDRPSVTYYSYSNSTSCEGTPAIGPLYDVPLDTCQTSTSTDDKYMYLNGYVSSSSVHCSFDGAYALSTDYADGKCDSNSWMRMSATKTGQCKLYQTSAYTPGNTYQYYSRKYSCPSNPPVTAFRPIFPPDTTTNTDIAVKYSCDYLNCTSCLPSTAYKLGQCQEQTGAFPPTAGTLESVKRGCTQDGKNFGLASFRDNSCQTAAVRTELSTTVCTNQNGYSPYYLVCPTQPKASAQIGPLPAIGRITYNRHNCAAPTTDSPSPYYSASYAAVGCTWGSYYTANASTITLSQYYGTNSATCNTSSATNYGNTVYQADVCIDNPYSTASQLATSSFSTSPAFTISTGTATSDSVKPSAYGDIAFITFSTPTSLYNASLYKNDYIRCASTYTYVRASRISVSVDSNPSGSGSIVSLTFAPSVVPGDVTPGTAVGLLAAKGGKLPSNLISDIACDPVNGVYASSGGTVVFYGTTAKFSMVFNMPIGSLTATVKAQLISEVALVANIDSSRLTAPTMISATGSSQTTVYFEITASTDASVTTPSAALQLITAKVQSTEGMPGTYASQAVKQAPTVTADGTGGSSAASALSVNTIMQLAMALAAIFALMQ